MALVSYWFKKLEGWVSSIQSPKVTPLTTEIQVANQANMISSSRFAVLSQISKKKGKTFS